MTKKAELTEEQKRESIKNDINFNMFVEAGAGAGKTTILIDRIINQFKSGKYKPENIVAITFTKKAAEELKGRMVKCLRKASNEETDEEKKEYLKNALMNLDKMQLSTIHSFCFKLLMERAFDARLRMDVSMLEEGDVDQDKKDYFSKWFKSKEKSYEEYSELANLDIWKYYDLAFNAFSTMSDLPQDVIIEINKSVLKKKFKDLPVVYQKEKDGSISVNDYGNPKEDSKSQEYKDRKEYQSNFIINYVMPAVEGYRKIHNSHYISNNQLLIQTRDLLRDNADARNYFRKKYKTLYVDEFQDTDKVQVDLVFALCGDDKKRLRDGALFVVGDPKQSIYRFRGADVPLYLDVKDKMSKMENTKVYELNYNYRTHKDVLDFVNYNAKRNLMSYTEMMSMSKSNNCNDKKQFKGIYHVGKPSADKKYDKTKIVEKTNDSDKKTYNKEVEKKYLSAIINGLVNSNAVIYDKNLNGDNGGTRNIQYKDFLILCRTKSNMDLYMDYMMKNGIPVQISSYVDISCNNYFKRLKDIYGLFAYPYDKKIREAFAQSYYDEVFTKEKYKNLRNVIKNIYDKTKVMDAYTKLLYVSHNLNLYNDNHKNIRKDILKRIETQVEQMVESVINTCANNEQDVYEGITNFIENGYEREIAIEDDVDAVRFMNIHKAKGLEGKIVIVCQRYEKSNDELSSLHINDKKDVMHYYISLVEGKGYGNKIYYPSYYNNEKLVEKAINEQNEEISRLAYVECTRPMEAIIFMEYRNKNDMFESYDFSMAKYLFADDEYPEIKAELEKTQVEPMNAIEYKGNEFLIKKDDSQYEYTYKKESPSNLEEYGDTTNNVLENVEVEKNDVVKPALRGAVYGTTMHRAFELYFNYKKDSGSLDGKKVLEIANKAILESLATIKKKYGDDNKKIVELFKNEIVNDLEAIMTNENIKNLVKDSKIYYTEYPFTYKDEKGNLINGKADLIFENNDGSITIVDYKSDYNPGLEKDKFAELLEGRYNDQLELYKKSFAEIYGVEEKQINTFIYNKNKF